MFNLSRILHPFSIAADHLHCQGLTLDSREVVNGDVFVAVSGYETDGRKYIGKAIEKGAIAVICETDDALDHGRVEDQIVPIIQFYQLKQNLSALAALAFDEPAQQLKVVGITGTNGKTSVSQIIASLLTQLGHKCGVIGTTGQGVWPALTETKNTTPDAIGIQQELATELAAKAQYCAMEVSSHGLDQKRVDGVNFEVAVFTNLTRDHLDYHQTMTAYAEAKFRLFTQPGLQTAVINIDDDTGREFRQRLLDKGLRVISYSSAQGVLDAGEYINAHDLQLTARGLSFAIDSSWGSADVAIDLLGEFNVANVLAAFASLLAMDFSLEDIVDAAKTLQPVSGRMEMFGGHNEVTAVVDYAHTPDALAHALSSLRQHCRGELYSIFGCGGDRDKGKRPMMGEIAERLSDKVVVTNDNPRSEDPQQIADDILAGCKQPQQIKVILDRRSAIEKTLRNANRDDIVLIAGKGHENYQIIKNKTQAYDERQFVAETLERMSGVSHSGGNA
jgi:UDP-N-acetylmuramoyl-L-alanyl-D-glutamate--2,6-diaminopimelate ligase